MRGEDRLLEIVGHRPLPLGDGTPQPPGERNLRHAGPHAGIGLAGRDPLGGFHDDERHSPEVQRKRRHHLSAASAQLGRVAHEKGRVAAQLRGTGDEFLLGKTQPEERVEGLQHRRPVRRTAAQPRAERHALHEPDHDAVNAVAVTHQTERLHADILLRGAVHGDPLRAELRPGASRAQHLHLVEESPHGKHRRLQVVISVRPTAQHVEAQVYFAVRSQNHIRKGKNFLFLPYEIPHRNRNRAPPHAFRLRKPHARARFVLRRAHRRPALPGEIPRRGQPHGHPLQPALRRRGRPRLRPPRRARRAAHRRPAVVPFRIPRRLLGPHARRGAPPHERRPAGGLRGAPHGRPRDPHLRHGLGL